MALFPPPWMLNVLADAVFTWMLLLPDAVLATVIVGVPPVSVTWLAPVPVIVTAVGWLLLLLRLMTLLPLPDTLTVASAPAVTRFDPLPEMVIAAILPVVI